MTISVALALHMAEFAWHRVKGVVSACQYLDLPNWVATCWPVPVPIWEGSRGVLLLMDYASRTDLQYIHRLSRFHQRGRLEPKD